MRIAFSILATLAFSLAAQTPSTGPSCPTPPVARTGTAIDKAGKSTKFVNLAGVYVASSGSTTTYVRTPGELVFSGTSNGCESESQSFSKATWVLVSTDSLAAVKIGESWSPTTVGLTFADGTQDSFKCSGVTVIDIYVGPSTIMRLNGDQVLGLELKLDPLPPASGSASGESVKRARALSASTR